MKEHNLNAWILWLLKPSVYCFWKAIDKSIWFSERKWILWVEWKPDLMICYSASCIFTLSWRLRNHSLRSQAWKHFTQKEKQIRHKNNRFRIILLRISACLQLHLIKILQSTWSDFRYWLYCCYRHVELRLFAIWVIHWRSTLSRWKWIRASIVHNGS